MPGENIQDWSITAANNANSDSSIGWAEGQARASVNNSARSMMAAHAKHRNLLNGSIVTCGTADAQTFFSGLDYTVIPTGLRVLLKIGPSLTNTGPATLNMDNISAVAIKNSALDLKGKELTENAYAEFSYDGTNWILLYSNIFVQTITNTSVVHIIEIPAATPVPVVDFTAEIDDTYTEYLFTGINLVPSVLGAELWMLVSTDGGATWNTGATDYSWAQGVATEGGIGATGSHGDSKILIANNIHNASHIGCCFTARVITPSLATHSTTIETNASATAAVPTTLTRWTGAGRFNLLTPVTGIRFLMSSGTIASGSIKMAGIL